MLTVILLLIFFFVFVLMLGLFPLESRPKLKLQMTGPEGFGQQGPKPKKGPLTALLGLVRKLAFFNKPFIKSELGQKLFKDLSLAQMPISAEEFLLIKEILAGGLAFVFFKTNSDPSFLIFSILLGLAGGWILPEFWLKARVKALKESILKELPDTVDLLGLCVNAGLDFMMALKYVVEKSKPTVIVEELRIMMQEINVGKPRRDALRDLSKKYDMPDLATFSRTLIQADRMGTSVSEALNILSEDMREARYRRGEAMALKAPLKMLIPLLFCIFPVVGILVGGPIFLDFMHNNPLQGLGK